MRRPKYPQNALRCRKLSSGRVADFASTRSQTVGRNLGLFHFGQRDDDAAHFGGAGIFDQNPQCAHAGIRLHKLMERKPRFQIVRVFLVRAMKTDENRSRIELRQAPA
jgi:hypothetical protein